MDIQYKSREEMIKDSEKSLRLFEVCNTNGFYQNQGYTEQEIADLLDLCKKEVAYMKKEISFEEYIAAYHKVYERKVI